jgi:DNA-binding MarR family transcriptional regulator
MQEDQLKKLYQYMFEFMTLYHQRVGSIFCRDDREPYRCNKNQQKALFIIKKRHKITLTDLGKSMDMRKGSLTTLIDSLENMGLVCRERDEKDRRKMRISLTREGEIYLCEKIKVYEQYFIERFQTISSEDIQKIMESLQNVIYIMRKIG